MIPIPTKQASINTASAKLRALQAFFNEVAPQIMAADVPESLKDTYRQIRVLFMLLCAAFNQPRYRVDKQLNVPPDAMSGVS